MKLSWAGVLVAAAIGVVVLIEARVVLEFLGFDIPLVPYLVGILIIVVTVLVAGIISGVIKTDMPFLEGE